MLVVPTEMEAAIRQHAETEYPNECCGALLGKSLPTGDRVSDTRRLRNVHEDGHARRYLVDPEQLRALLEEEVQAAWSIIGFYHSHPDHPSQPSEYDRVHAAPWYTYAIVAVARGASEKLSAWKLDDAGQFVEEAIVSGSPPQNPDPGEG
ncbi:MAG: M67 family metallopeptidase [Armatimonadetes bacterium]|nr:M67 family metallopeptidase [Armatimonadota bacterium]MDE2206626.1 M67 family metallopeptidase [Armatimonadota bacterium]